MDEQSLASEIAGIIADYRLGEIPTRTPEVVIGFVDRIQRVCSDWMGGSERMTLMEGLCDALRQQYWSASRISVELARFVPRIRDDSRVARWAILSMQESSSSQTHLVGQIENPGLPIHPAVQSGFDGVLYIDDATFTGRTLAKYLGEIHDQILDLDERPAQLVIWHLCEYSVDAVSELRSKVERLEQRGLAVHFHQVEQFRRRDRHGRAEAALIPRREHSELPRVKGFLKSSTALKKIADSDELWRDHDEVIDDQIFGTPNRRDVVERAFLEVGCWLRSKAPFWNHTMRPLGFVAESTAPSLGFGSMFCTCFNSSNTSPLALWWGDPTVANSALSNWDPLLPRRPQ